jgi:N-acetylglucosamine kinase-like BadF-type ATPase
MEVDKENSEGTGSGLWVGAEELVSMSRFSRRESSSALAEIQGELLRVSFSSVVAWMREETVSRSDLALLTNRLRELAEDSLKWRFLRGW